MKYVIYNPDLKKICIGWMGYKIKNVMYYKSGEIKTFDSVEEAEEEIHRINNLQIDYHNDPHNLIVKPLNEVQI